MDSTPKLPIKSHESGKKDEVLDYSKLGLGTVFKENENGIVICSKGFFYTNQKTGEITKIKSKDYDLKYISDVNENGTVISDDKIIFFDFIGSSKPVEIEIKNNSVVDKLFSSTFSRIATNDKIYVFSHVTGKLKKINISSYEVGNIIYFSRSNYIGEDGLVLQGDKKALLIDNQGNIEYELKYEKNVNYGIITSLSSNGAFSSTKIIKKYYNGDTLTTIHANDLGMNSFFGEFSGIIPGVGKTGIPEVAKIDTNTGEILYKSINLTTEKRNTLRELGIYDHSRFSSEEMIDHIIHNRKNIEKLGDKKVYLIMTPKFDYTSAFVGVAPDKFLESHDVLYYENHLESDFINSLEDIQANIKKGVGIESMFLWGHGESDSLMFSYTSKPGNLFNRWRRDENYLQVQDIDRYNKYSQIFINTTEIILPSCWTGRDGVDGNNLIHMIANSFGKYVLEITGPQKPTTANYMFLPINNGRNVYTGFSFNSTPITKIRGSEYIKNGFFK